MVDEKKNGVSATALKALKTLELIAASPAPVSVRDIAELLETDKATSYRMLITLQESGFVVRDDATKLYSLSYKVVSLSRNLLAENEVSKIILRELRELAVQTKETLHYNVLDGKETVLIHRVKGSQLVNVEFQVGDRSPLNCTSIGKAILAFQDIRFIEEVIAAGLVKKAANSISDADKFREELRKIRSQGYAIDDHEYSDSMRCIAVPVFEGGGRISSGISISGPDSRFTLEKLEELSITLLSASRNLSKYLGGLPWH